MNSYPNNLKIREALQLYFSKYDLMDGGYDLKYFQIKVGPVSIPFPNTKGRLKAVRLHDVHHIVTEYEATLRGEAEIGAWEIASGCGKYYAAWLLNFGSLFYGIFFFPRYIFKAFLRGRSCITNLYHQIPYDDILLNKTVGELRGLIEPAIPHRKWKDYVAFLSYCLLVTAPAILLIIIISFLFIKLYSS